MSLSKMNNWGGYWAARDGYWVGYRGDAKRLNPCSPDTPNHKRWDDAWEEGHQEHLSWRERAI